MKRGESEHAHPHYHEQAHSHEEGKGHSHEHKPVELETTSLTSWSTPDNFVQAFDDLVKDFRFNPTYPLADALKGQSTNLADFDP